MASKRKGMPPEKYAEMMERVAQKMVSEGLIDQAGADAAVDRAYRPLQKRNGGG